MSGAGDVATDLGHVFPAAAGLLRLGNVDSTSAEAMRRAAAGETGPLWITAASQSSGRGRSGRQWTSAPGNLYASLLISPRAPARVVHQLAFVAGIAAHEAIASLIVVRRGDGALSLKWPNDLLLGDAKVGGILTEVTTHGGRLAAVIGIGINVVHAPDVADRKTTALAAAGGTSDVTAVLTRLAVAVDRWLAIWQEGAGFRTVRSAWVERGPRLGQPMTIKEGTGSGRPEDGVRHGHYAGLDDDGALLLTDAGGGITRVTYGDVSNGWIVTPGNVRG